MSIYEKTIYIFNGFVTKTDEFAKRSLKCTIQMVLVFKMFKSWKVEWSFYLFVYRNH